MPTHSVALVLTQIALAILVGLATSYQPGVNAKFASACPSPLYGGVINFAVGLVVMLVVVLVVRVAPPSVQNLAKLPWWAWTGGALGAFFVAMAIILIRPMGAANYFAAMVTGQFVGSMVIDHFGHMGLNTHPFTWGRAVGILLMGAGVACIRLL